MMFSSAKVVANRDVVTVQQVSNVHTSWKEMAAECTERPSSVMVLGCWLDNRICKLASYCLYGIQPRGTLNGFRNFLKQHARKHKLQLAAR